MNGTLNLVSVGPGEADLLAPLARQALEESEVIVGYELYLRWIQPWIAGKELHSPPLTQERARAQTALECARAGRRVALVSSGDIGIYAMAALAFEEMREDDLFDVRVVPGITAGNACASLLGAPLSHDFATLSLSELLCPWQWIEERARAMARADLATVLYNVQSRGRQEGVYRILRIMLEHKPPKTLCGVVRNAYRPDQAVDICTLDQLPQRGFDMLTTVVIGNRFTRRKRGWIFTPRGYGGWNSAREASRGDPEPAVAAEPPARGVWVFSGTSDGNALANAIAARGVPVVLSVATGYGAEVARHDCPGVHVLTGGHGTEARRQQLRRSDPQAVIDATHPYAADISAQLIGLTRELGLPYLRFERPSVLGTHPAELCDGADAAAHRAIERGRRIFLATGSKDLATFVHAQGAHERQWFVRLTPAPDYLRRALELGVPPGRICAMQGPFSQAFNEALWRAWGIDCVVTKDSGEAGGFSAKAAAAAALGIPLIVMRRPRMDYPALTDNFAGVFDALTRMSAVAAR
ncbi:MAG TPA: precorrin-3B C(17)-methyltransferase [Candidatus Binataceae bacterium]|nr:precorrin-3B C(17)-methyltransferase [Candidatus Binataceae bacterium]